MTVAELVNKLNSLPKEAKVFVWRDGERYEINEEDVVDWWEDTSEGLSTADINLKP